MPSGSHKPVQLSDLAALNDEIVSLTRAKIPLQSGLRSLAKDGGGRMFELASSVASAVENGESLESAIESQGKHIPKAWATVVKAGVRSGKLTSALETISDFAWELVNLRRHIGQAMIYPLMLVSLAWFLFVTFVTDMLLQMSRTYAQIRIPVSGLFEWLLWFAMTCRRFVWAFPILLAAFVLLWVLSKRANTLEFSGFFSPLRWIPGVGRIGRNYSYYSFANLMALLCEQGVPLDESLELSSNASGNKRVITAATKMAELDRQGNISKIAERSYPGFPSFLQWVFTRQQTQSELARSLKMAADVYKRRANNQVLWLKYTFPIFASLMIGGLITLIYTLTLFYPLSELFGRMSSEF